jgi:mono/diheme cytochrome c family protein
LIKTAPHESRPINIRSASLRALICAAPLLAVRSAIASAPAEAYTSLVKPFFNAHCVECHGPKKSKGKITLHSLDGDLAAGQELARWEKILEMLESGEMPPEDEAQPNENERQAVAQWIESGLREYVNKASEVAREPTTRRLTNSEYENTMRDLLGIPLKLIDNLPKDPIKAYTFNNTAEFMRMGPEQIDRYLECARRAMASVIVDPAKPEVHQTRREWVPHGLDKGLGGDELGVWGNRRNTPATGMGLKSFPKTGAYRIRVKASAILPPGISEIPLRLVMGYDLNSNSGTLQIEPVGTVHLRNTPDAPRVFEFVGRMENHPAKPGLMKNGVRQPDSMAITPQNLYDDGTLNDGNRNLAMPRAIIEWMEFEAPLTEAWPPEHHTHILFDSPLRTSNPPAYVREVLDRFISRAYRRPATQDEIERFEKIYHLVAPEMDTMEIAMRETLAMVLISPPFLYHMPLQADGTSRQYAVAARLSYFLWGSMPDETLLHLAASGKLDDPAVIKQQTLRLLADERSNAFVDSFTRQWLSLDKMQTVPINRELFPRFLYYVSVGERAGTEVPYRPTIRDFMLTETLAFIAELIRRNDSALNIVDADFTCLNQPLAAHYGVSGVEGHEFRPVALRPEHRLGGLLTQGSMLVGNGTGSAPHPIYRAVWLREAILGDEVKPPPAEVPALSDSAGESAEKALTIKDLLVKHRQEESCNDCHVRLDPWGIPFERYNAIGKYQPFVPQEGTRVSSFNHATHKDLEGYAAYRKSINTVEVHADARVPHGPAVDGIADLKAHLLKERQDDIAENVLRRLLRYSIGRELTYRDRFAVDELLSQSSINEYRLQDMIVSICQSTTFLETRDQP